MRAAGFHIGPLPSLVAQEQHNLKAVAALSGSKSARNGGLDTILVATKKKAGPGDNLIGHRLRACRSRARLSQTAVAVQLGIKQQQYQKYESGKNRIARQTLFALATILKTSVAGLLRDVHLMESDPAGFSEGAQADYAPDEPPATGLPRGYGQGQIRIEELRSAEDRETLLNHFRMLKRRQDRRD